jgi:hypothetical protein
MHTPSNEFAFGKLQSVVGLLGMCDSSQEIGCRLKITIAASGASDAYFNTVVESSWSHWRESMNFLPSTSSASSLLPAAGWAVRG